MKHSTRWIKQNLFVITIAFMCNFTAFKGLQNLQSSLHHKSGIGTISQSISYICGFLSNLFLPEYLISTVGHKWTISIGIIGFMTWVVANAYATWWTLVPASVLVGACTGPIWIAQNAYVTSLANMWSDHMGEDREIILSRFFGIFWGIFHCSRVFGSLISTYVLQPTEEGIKGATEHELSFCGANDCPGNVVTSKHLTELDSVTLTTLVITYISLAILGFLLIVLLMDDIKGSEVKSKPGGKEIFLDTLRAFTVREQFLMVPYLVGQGTFKAFIMADWPKSYITCSVGMAYVGITSLPFGIFRSLAAYAGGNIATISGRVPIMVTSSIIQIALQIFLLSWTQLHEDMHTFLVIAAVQGAALGLAAPNLSAFVGTKFPNNVNTAFAAYNMLDILGHSIGYGYSSVLCTKEKIYIVLVLVSLGLFGYLCVELFTPQPKFQYRRERQISETIEHIHQI